MTEQEMMQSAAYAEVLADRGADAPRERLADWLEDRWPDRARLIRVCVEDNREHRRSLSVHVHPDDLPYAASRLKEALQSKWEEPIRSLGWAREWQLVRGCIGYVEVDAAAFLEQAPQLFARFPVRHLYLRGSKEVIGDLAACSYLSLLRGLELRWSSLDDDDIRVLVDSPHIRNLRWLSLGQNRIGIAGYEALCASPNLPSLVKINLVDNVGPDPVQHWTLNSEGYWVDPLPGIGVELERKYGPKPWLSAPSLIATYPPVYSAFDGDDPV